MNYKYKRISAASEKKGSGLYDRDFCRVLECMEKDHVKPMCGLHKFKFIEVSSSRLRDK